MKKLLNVMCAGVMLSGFAVAQYGTQQTPPQQTTPPTQTAPAPAQTTPAPAQQPAPKKGQPQAKTQEEFAAYQAAAGQADLSAAETAADDFAKKYPQSELRTVLYGQLLQKYYNGNKPDKVTDIGRKILAVEPDHTMALIMTATALAETTRETDLDRDQKYAEAMKDADTAVKTIDTGLAVPPTMTPEQVAAAKKILMSMAHASMGYIEMNRKNYGLSEEHFKEAVALSADQPDATNYLRLAVAQDNQKKYPDALANASKAIQLAEAQNNTQIATMAKSEKDRLTKLSAGAPPAQKPAPQATPTTTATPPKQ